MLLDTQFFELIARKSTYKEASVYSRLGVLNTLESICDAYGLDKVAMIPPFLIADLRIYGRRLPGYPSGGAYGTYLDTINRKVV